MKDTSASPPAPPCPAPGAPAPDLVALYGGSFNPPHVGHVMATAYVLAAYAPRELWWIPVGRHAFAKGRALAAFEDRLAMCELATADFGPRVRVLDLEGRRRGTSRTIDTVRALRREHPSVRFRLVLGADLWPDTPSWKRWAELERLAPPIWIGRAGYPMPPGAPAAPAIPDVSSTQARRALASPSPEQAAPVLPQAVWRYAHDRRLYDGPDGDSPLETRALRVFVVGAGRAGRSLAVLLERAGHELVGVSNATEAGAARTEALLGHRPQRTLRPQIPDHTDVVWLCTPDRHLAATAAALHEAGALGAQRTVVHSSGSLPAQVLRRAAPLAGGVAALHPLFPFGEPHASATDVVGAAWSLDGDPAGQSVARALLAPLRIDPTALAPHHRALYHAAATVSGNAPVALAALGRDLLAATGLRPEAAHAALLPLIQGAVANLARVSPEQALTGPIARGDADVVRAHLAAVRAERPQDLAHYRRQAALVLRLVEASGHLPAATLNALRLALEPAPTA